MQIDERTTARSNLRRHTQEADRRRRTFSGDRMRCGSPLPHRLGAGAEQIIQRFPFLHSATARIRGASDRAHSKRDPSYPAPWTRWTAQRFCARNHQLVACAQPKYCSPRRSLRVVCAISHGRWRRAEKRKRGRISQALSFSGETRAPIRQLQLRRSSYESDLRGARRFQQTPLFQGQDGGGSAAAPPAHRDHWRSLPSGKYRAGAASGIQDRVPRVIRDRSPFAQSTGPPLLSGPASGTSRGCFSFPKASGN